MFSIFDIFAFLGKYPLPSICIAILTSILNWLVSQLLNMKQFFQALPDAYDNALHGHCLTACPNLRDLDDCSNNANGDWVCREFEDQGCIAGCKTAIRLTVTTTLNNFSFVGSIVVFTWFSLRLYDYLTLQKIEPKLDQVEEVKPIRKSKVTETKSKVREYEESITSEDTEEETLSVDTPSQCSQIIPEASMLNSQVDTPKDPVKAFKGEIIAYADHKVIGFYTRISEDLIIGADHVTESLISLSNTGSCIQFASAAKPDVVFEFTPDASLLNVTTDDKKVDYSVIHFPKNIASKLGVAVCKMSKASPGDLISSNLPELDSTKTKVLFKKSYGTLSNRDDNAFCEILHSASTQPGSSGSALKNASGHIVGIHVGSQPTNNLNYALRVDPLILLLDSNHIEEESDSSRGRSNEYIPEQRAKIKEFQQKLDSSFTYFEFSGPTLKGEKKKLIGSFSNRLGSKQVHFNITTPTSVKEIAMQLEQEGKDPTDIPTLKRRGEEVVVKLAVEKSPLVAARLEDNLEDVLAHAESLSPVEFKEFIMNNYLATTRVAPRRPTPDETVRSFYDESTGKLWIPESGSFASSDKSKDFLPVKENTIKPKMITSQPQALMAPPTKVDQVQGLKTLGFTRKQISSILATTKKNSSVQPRSKAKGKLMTPGSITLEQLQALINSQPRGSDAPVSGSSRSTTGTTPSGSSLPTKSQPTDSPTSEGLPKSL